ncbi:MAG: DUF1467 family protein [Proteobacteria bacterium]|nr:DUF1467 family protein [Pseudomonadota bacterium]
MGPVTGFAVYFILWWLTLFMVLPFGVRAQGDVSEGHEAGAPARPRIIIKMLITTVISFIFWLIFYMIDTYDLIKISDL